MNRREFMQCAALLAAGSLRIPAGWALTGEQQAFLAARRNFVDSREPDFFDTPQRSAIDAAAEQIIPATDTPGARDAGVPRFIELMVSGWFNVDERELFMTGLADLQQRAGGDFAALDGAAQVALLEALEDEAADASWYDLGNITRIWDSGAPFICQLKELTVLGFFLSEVGSTQVLREMPMGSFDGDIPLAAEDTAWAAELPIRLMNRA